MNEFDCNVHALLGALPLVRWQDIRPEAGGFKYYYAEGRVYLVKSPTGWIRIVKANSPFGAWRNALRDGPPEKVGDRIAMYTQSGERVLVKMFVPKEAAR